MFKRLLVKLAKELDNNNIPYMIIGGQAVLLYGEPRLTRDIDITLGLEPDEWNQISEITDELNLKILVDNPQEFIRKTMVLPVLEEESEIRVDFIFSFSEYERSALKRINKVDIENYQVNFASLEDVVIHKIVSGRPRDIEDVKIILLKNETYNSKYIEKWLSKFDESLNEDFLKTFINIVEYISK